MSGKSSLLSKLLTTTFTGMDRHFSISREDKKMQSNFGIKMANPEVQKKSK
jgi:hypothetical protein